MNALLMAVVKFRPNTCVAKPENIARPAIAPAFISPALKRILAARTYAPKMSVAIENLIERSANVSSEPRRSFISAKVEPHTAVAANRSAIHLRFGIASLLPDKIEYRFIGYFPNRLGVQVILYPEREGRSEEHT